MSLSQDSCIQIPPDQLLEEIGLLVLYRHVVADPDTCFAELRDTLPWRQDFLQFGGRRIAIPRLQTWHGEPHCVYSYSGLAMQPRPWTARLDSLRALAELCSGHVFNCVLANLYRNGQDSVGWHADDESALGETPVVASFSFGATRRFRIRRKQRSSASLGIDLPDNSLLVMGPGFQRDWQHHVPRCRSAGPRINLTFRFIAGRPTARRSLCT